LAIADCDQYDAADQANSAKDGREWHPVFFIGADLEWTGIDYFFARGVGESAPRHRDHADGDEDDADNASRFHAAIVDVKAGAGP